MKHLFNTWVYGLAAQNDPKGAALPRMVKDLKMTEGIAR